MEEHRVKEEVKAFCDKGFLELRLSLPLHFPCELGTDSTSCFHHVPWSVVTTLAAKYTSSGYGEGTP